MPESPQPVAATTNHPRESGRRRPPVSILMYHQVGEFPAPKSHRAGFCHIRRFQGQMAYLKLFGYRVISLPQAIDGLFHGATLPERAVVLTFDDGYENFKEYAFPVLQKHDFPATVFLVSGCLGRKARWLENDGRYGPPLMAAATLRELVCHRVTFGSHSITHPRLSRLDPVRMRAEILMSKRQLQEVLGEDVEFFCYPYGDYNERVRDTVEEAGYSAALTCIRGAANSAVNPFEIPRKAISYGDNLLGYFWKLHMKHQRKDNRPVAHPC
jgi:peptidoglycan/xylan/chitin deacetylase (PgdA/CDA1 family)